MKGISLIHWLIERDKKIIFSDNDSIHFYLTSPLKSLTARMKWRYILSYFKVFSETSIGGNAYLRNMVHLPFFLQNSGFRFKTSSIFYFFSCKVCRCKFKEPSTKKRGMQDSQRYPFKPNKAKEDVVVFLDNCLILTVFSIVFEEIRKWLYENPQLKIENNQYQEYMMDAIYSGSGYSYESDMPLP